jgi:hypothetical protein
MDTWIEQQSQLEVIYLHDRLVLCASPTASAPSSTSFWTRWTGPGASLHQPSPSVPRSRPSTWTSWAAGNFLIKLMELSLLPPPPLLHAIQDNPSCPIKILWLETSAGWLWV